MGNSREAPGALPRISHRLTCCGGVCFRPDCVMLCWSPRRTAPVGLRGVHSSRKPCQVRPACALHADRRLHRLGAQAREKCGLILVSLVKNFPSDNRIQNLCFQQLLFCNSKDIVGEDRDISQFSRFKRTLKGLLKSQVGVVSCI